MDGVRERTEEVSADAYHRALYVRDAAEADSTDRLTPDTCGRDAAAFISLEIVKDGYASLRNSVAQLMNKRPTDVESKEKDPVVDEVQKALERLDWVREARVRLREDGDTLTGEGFVVPRDGQNILRRLAEAGEAAHAVDWRLHDIQIVPVPSLGRRQGEKAARA